MDMVTARSIMNNITTNAIGIAFGCTNLGKRVGDTFVMDKETTTSCYTPKKGSLLTNKIVYRRTIDTINNSITVFVAVRYGSSCVDLLEIHSVFNGDAWVYDKLTECSDDSGTIMLRKDGALQDSKEAWGKFESRLAGEFTKLIERG